MKTEKPYADLVSQAERAVGSIKDPELRRVAFERVLDDLLATGGTLTSGPARHADAASATKPAKQPASVKSNKSRRGPKTYVRDLVDDGFFKKPKTIAEVKAELSNRGHHIAITSLSGPLQSLCQDKVLRRHKGSGKGKKQTFNYSEW